MENVQPLRGIQSLLDCPEEVYILVTALRAQDCMLDAKIVDKLGHSKMAEEFAGEAALLGAEVLDEIQGRLEELKPIFEEIVAEWRGQREGETQNNWLGLG